jgi:hypothetical protein
VIIFQKIVKGIIQRGRTWRRRMDTWIITIGNVFLS